MTTMVRRRLAFGILAGLALLGVITFSIVAGLLTGEEWCSDRSPWWGPPQDPNSSCSGLAWARDHPDEYPWTMPR